MQQRSPRALLAVLGMTPASSALCPPAVYLSTVAEAVVGSPVGLEKPLPGRRSAFTGEVNAAMLTDVACRYDFGTQ